MQIEQKEEERLNKIVAVTKEWKDRQHFRKATAMRAKQYGIKLPLKDFRKNENDAVKELKKLISQTKIGQKLLKFRGIDTKSIALLISFLHPIDVWDGPRSIRHYMGKIPKDAILNKKINRKAHNHDMKAKIRWLIQLQLQHNGIYKAVYNELKDEIQQKYPEWANERKHPKGKTHLENAAFSRTMYELVKDVWLSWKGLEGSRLDLFNDSQSKTR